ncbi:transporter substrate-binding domain-containing protein [Paramaledivibacter caminithermalis]|uniref:histidine kinase n=1 Tax=Paramaledivibacter caminithermalis (strain DSM 15212 / CIP 107654 / DViRD3) TaxID=1121301 RepID=A0A1M6LRF1_PARC5|nr:transporter substrate-binding domain-containing protein [Paramaledivibacter caminithermalis]SHJ73730.1 His Kinase A (phospho-acceptor) domain-containing protein [Paramaledivibacter caminithermalis DSM 15212]
MKKLYILFILIFLMLVPNNIHARSLDDNEKVYITITIAGDDSLPPFEYVDGKGIYKGFNIDIMRAISIEEGIEIEIIPMPWYKAIDALNNGEIDAIQGMKYSKTRDINYDFSMPYIQTPNSIFVRNDNKYIHEINDLKDKRVAIQKNDISKYLLANRDIENLIEVNNQEEALIKLINKEIDAYVGNKLTGAYYIQKKGFEEYVKTVGEDLLVENYCVAVLDGNNEIIDIFNDGIKKIISNGTYDKIYKKWFGEYFYDNSKILKNILVALGVAFLLVVLITIFTIKWNRQLKERVEERTIELKRENILKEKILNSIFSYILVVDRDKKVLLMNDKAKRLIDNKKDFTYLNDTVLGKIIDNNDINEVTQRGIEIKNKEVVSSIDDISTYQYNLSPISIDNDNFGAVISIKDITEEKMLRERLMATDKLKTLGRLAATVAHEIKNPLTAIKAYVELMPEKIGSERFRENLLEDVPREIDRLDKFINDLLNYSRHRRGKKEELNIIEVVKDTLRFLSREIKKHDIEMVCDIHKDAKVLVSRDQLRHILMNLLLNAIDAVKVNSVPKIKVYSAVDGQYIKLIVEDNGKGIDEKTLKKVFEPYYTTKKEGVGLGLAITQQMVKKNNGEISVESKLGIGTKFIITLGLLKKGEILCIDS